MIKRLKRIMLTTIIIIATFSLSVFLFMQLPKFGAHPKGERLERIKASPNYKDGAFQNLNHTPVMTGKSSYAKAMKELFTAKNKTPKNPIPSIKTDLLKLDAQKDVLVWFGHSSYFMQLDGKKILVDPVLSGHASPISFTTKAFKGSDIYSPDDIPEIDYLFITHDHWDHLDHKAMLRLKPKVKKIICGLGVGAHLERWGFDETTIIEKDWNEKVNLDSGFVANITSARHFTGRGFKHKQTLWISVVLQTPSAQIFIAGDGGYDTHFAEIGKKFGEFDLAILENGQYNEAWKYIHMMPDEVLKAAKELNAKSVLPVHSGKFALANHAWYEPLKRISGLHTKSDPRLITPIIGEEVFIKDSTQIFNKWWEGLE